MKIWQLPRRFWVTINSAHIPKLVYKYGKTNRRNIGQWKRRLGDPVKTEQVINWLIPYQSFLLPTDAQENCFKRILKFTSNQLQYILMWSPSSGSVLYELAKVTVLKQLIKVHHIVCSLVMVITPKHVGAGLMQILTLFLKQFYCASVSNKILIIARCMVQTWKLAYTLLQLLVMIKKIGNDRY